VACQHDKGCPFPGSLLRHEGSSSPSTGARRRQPPRHRRRARCPAAPLHHVGLEPTPRRRSDASAHGEPPRTPSTMTSFAVRRNLDRPLARPLPPCRRPETDWLAAVNWLQEPIDKQVRPVEDRVIPGNIIGGGRRLMWNGRADQLRHRRLTAPATPVHCYDAGRPAGGPAQPRSRHANCSTGFRSPWPSGGFTGVQHPISHRNRHARPGRRPRDRQGKRFPGPASASRGADAAPDADCPGRRLTRRPDHDSKGRAYRPGSWKPL